MEEKPTIHFIITTSLIPIHFETRKEEYLSSISTLFQEVSSLLSIYPIKSRFIIIENNGARRTFLDDLPSLYPHLSIHVIYTNHNQIHTSNKGLKELLDIAFVLQLAGLFESQACSSASRQEDRQIAPQDMIVKITGRYRVGKNCTFLHILYRDLHLYDAFIRHGAFMYPSQKMEERDKYDAITGLFAIRANVLQKDIGYYIQNIHEYDWVEWVIMMMIQNNITEERIHYFDYLGVWIKTAYMKEYQLF